MPIHQAINWVRDTAHDLWQLCHPVKQRGPDQYVRTWRPPDQGWIKVNNDAFSEIDFCGATACILRDHRGTFQGAQVRWYDRGLDACLMEAMACLDGLLLARQQGVQRVMLETDCLELTNLWKKKDVQRSSVDPVLREIDDLRLAFKGFSFSHVNRVCNKVAHVLAKQVSSTHRMEVWHVTPASVLELVLSGASAG